MLWRGLGSVCLVIALGGCTSSSSRTAAPASSPDESGRLAAPVSAASEVPGAATPLAEPSLPEASDTMSLGSRMQVRALGAPLVTPGATASFELPDGRPGWTTALPEVGMGVTPAFGHGKIFVGGGFASRTMYAMDARTGRVSWRVAAPDGGPSAAIVVDDKVIFNTESCTVFAVHAETGQLIWSRWLGDPLMSQPVAADGRVFSAHPGASTPSGYAMTAMNIADGAILWQQPVPADVVSAAVTHDGSLYFTTMDGTVHRLRQRDGQEVWRVSLGASTAPWVDGERVLLARRVEAPSGQSGPFEEQVVLSARDGRVIRGGEPIAAAHLTGGGRARELLVHQQGAWGSARSGQEHLGFRNVAEGWAYQGARPTVIDGRTYQVEGEMIQCRDVETGRLLWSRRYAQDGGALAVSPPAVVGSQMVVATVDGQVFGLDIDTGMTVWAYDVGEPVVFQPSVAQGWVYLATATGRVMAFQVGDASLDGWHMWGGNAAHEGPLAASPGVEDDADADAEDGGPGQGVMRVIVPDEARVEELALERTEVRANVSGFVASVTVRQVFANPHDEPLEAVYHFPLPSDAAVDAMTVVAGERRIRGRIERREQARVIYRRARDAGMLAALLEQQRPNLFTQRLANIPPGETISVELHYVQMLPYDQGSYEFTFPMVAGARAQDPTAEGDDEDLEQHAPGTRPRDVDLTVNIDAGLDIACLDSPSHQLEVDRPAPRTAVVRLARGDRIPNRDLVLRYEVAGDQPDAALLTHRDDRGGFFTLILQPARSGSDLRRTRRRLTLALDTSSSLYGPAMAQARAVAASVIDDLDDDESFQLVTFSDSVRTFADSPVRATSANLRRAERYLDDLRALGTTSMTEGLATALSQEPGPSNGLDMVVLVTDGYIASEAELLRLVQERLGDRRLFVIGVGPAPNRFLLERLAEVGRGALLVVSPGDEPSVVAQEFVERIADPQVTDLEIDWGELTVHSVYPRRLPDLFAGQPLLVHGRYDETGNGEAILRGRIGGRAWSERIQMTLDQGGSGNEAMAPIWARAAVHDGMNRLYLRDDEAAREMVTRLGLDFGLVTRFTSFVAVDDAALEAAEQASGEPAEAAVPQTPAPDLMAQASESGATDGPMPVYEPSMAVEAPMPSPPPPAAMPMGGGDLDSLLNSAVGGGGGARAPTKAAGTPGAAALARRLNSEAQPQGLSRVQIQSVIARHLPELRAAAARHGDVHGSVSIRFVVSSDGRVVSAEVDRSTLGGGPAERAILDIFRRMLFPSFAGPNVTVSYPINV